MPTQVAVRGATQATQEARTLTSRELDVNTTDTRLCVHDGSRAGGMPHVNARDAQNQEFTYAAASGTDTITATYNFTPGAYAAGQKFVFKAANTNTGSATFNANGLGAKTIKKKNVTDGTIDTLEAGDIIQGGIYTLFYDGTDMILESVDSGGATWQYTAAVTVTGATTEDLVTGLSGVTEVEIFLDNVAVQTGAGPLSIEAQLGDSGGFETASYDSRAGYIKSDATADTESSTSGLLVVAGGGVPSNTNFTGVIRLMLRDNANEWMAHSCLFGADGSVHNATGIKNLSSTLTQIRLSTTSAGFNGGTARVRYR